MITYGQEVYQDFDYKQYDMVELFKTKQYHLLYKCCEKLLLKVCDKYKSSLHLSEEDIEEIINFTYGKALLSFNPDNGKKTQFHTYATCILENELRMKYRRAKCLSKKNISFFSLELPILTEDSSISLQDTVEDPQASESYSHVDTDILLEHVLDWVSKNCIQTQVETFKMFLEGYTLTEIAKCMEVPRTTVRKRLDTVQGKVKKVFFPTVNLRQVRKRRGKSNASSNSVSDNCSSDNCSSDNCSSDNCSSL